MDENDQSQQFDIRVYVGMLFFRWQVIAICFLYCLLGGVLYVNLAPRKYLTTCQLMVYRDPTLVITPTASPWGSSQAHRYILSSDWLRERVVNRLIDEWGETIGSRSKMMLPVSFGRGRIRSTMEVSIKSTQPDYAEDFLKLLLEEHQKEWESLQMQSAQSAATILEQELRRLDEKIRQAEDDLIEYQRLHDIARVEARGSMESAYLEALMERRNQLTTELMLLESQYPELENASVGIISDVESLTRQTGAIEAEKPTLEGSAEGEQRRIELPESMTDQADPEEVYAGRGWQNLRVKLVRLRQREQELAQNMEPEHPQLRELRKQIRATESELDVAAEVALERLQDRYKALSIQRDAVEAAEYKWQAKNLLAMQRNAELKKLSSVVNRYEDNYQTLYTRLHDMRVSEELKAEHFRIVEAVETEPKPVWPDAPKILLMSVVLGLGSGLGIALLTQVLDNKIQSISDVENTLGIPFLGGVPYWVHSGLERSIRPIVTEEHASGAIEAYRSLRTSLIAALNKINEKIVIVTSADSREGKTLTTLNVSIMMAEMGKKVLLMDMDLRRGRIHRSLGLEKEPGVTDVLQRGGSLREVVRETRVENLYVASTGSSVDNHAELLQSSDLVGMLVDIQDDYDYILMDSSPVLRVTDTVILSTHGLGVVLYVARVNHTPKPLIKYSLDMLQDARILGLIMNSIEMHKLSSLYYTYQYPNYAYYSNAYAYGYDHYYYSYDDKAPPASEQRRRRRRTGKWRAIVDKLRRNFLPM